MIVTISKAVEMKMYNEYHERNLKEDYEVYKEINKFHHCFSKVELSETTGDSYWHESTKFLLKNDVIDVIIRYDSYRKRYSFYGDWDTSDLKNLSHYQISDIRKKFKEPRGVGKLSKKKITDWIKYEEDVYLACVKKNNELDNGVNSFLDSLKGENVNWFNQNPERSQWSGEIVKNGVVFKFSIDNGCVSQKIEVHYKTPSTLEAFKLLSDNKINRENKLKRILEWN